MVWPLFCHCGFLDKQKGHWSLLKYEIWHAKLSINTLKMQFIKLSGNCVFLCVPIRFPPITEDVLLQAFEVKPVHAIFIDRTLAIALYLSEEVIIKTAFCCFSRC